MESVGVEGGANPAYAPSPPAGCRTVTRSLARLLGRRSADRTPVAQNGEPHRIGAHPGPLRRRLVSPPRGALTR